MGSIVAVYTIPWCIDWVKVTKIVTVFDTSCETVVYSDGSDGTWWTEDCPVSSKDPEIYCFTNDNGVTTVSWFIDFDTTTTPSTPHFYDFNLVELIGYTQVPCSIEREKEKECREVLVAWTWYDIWDEVVLYIYSQWWDNIAPINSYELYYNITTWSYFVPANRSDLWPCTIVQKYIERIDMVDYIDPANSIQFTRIVEWVNGVATATYDIDNTWAIYTPTWVLVTKVRDQEYKSTCYRAIVDGAWFIAWDVLEFNVVFDPRNPRAPHYLNRTNRNTLWNVFEQSPAWVVGTFPALWSEVIPCEQYVECKKEVIPAIPMVYKQSWVPSNYVAYRIKDRREATSVYIHWLYGINAWSWVTLRGAGWVDYNWGSNPNWVLATDVANVQVMTDKALVDMWLAVWDAYYAVTTDNQSVWFLSPAAIALIPSNTFLQVYSWLLDTWNDYDRKFDVSYVAPYTSADVSLTTATSWNCIWILKIVEQDSCTWKETYRYVIEDWAGNLVDASTVISWFDEANVYVTCPEEPVAPVIEIPWWVLVPDTTIFVSFPNNIVSFTVSAQSGSYDISFDWGTTFLKGRKWSMTFWQGTIELIDASNVVVVSNGDVDIVRDTI